MSGLRERKKIKTRAEIKKQAFELFTKQGFTNTTIEQIAAASDVSASTFFRYFPTKEALILQDDFDPIMLEAFLNQPKEVPIFRAFRNAILEVMRNAPKEDLEQEYKRQQVQSAMKRIFKAMIEFKKITI